MPVDATTYPVNLVVAGRPCLVIGGGRVARRKVEGLLACGADVTVIAPDVDVAIAGMGVRVERRPYRSPEAGSGAYRLVVTATGDPEVDQVVFDDADGAGVWVNSADDPARCTFTLPAVVRRGPLQVTVSTGGHSPAVSSWLRRRLEADFGPEYETLVLLLSEARAALQADGRSTEGLAWQKALESDMLSLIRGGRISEARDRLQTCLSSS